jgi:hypothetical protein
MESCQSDEDETSKLQHLEHTDDVRNWEFKNYAFKYTSYILSFLKIFKISQVYDRHPENSSIFSKTLSHMRTKILMDCLTMLLRFQWYILPMGREYNRECEYMGLWRDAVVPTSRDKFGTRQENKFTTLKLSPVPLQYKQTVLYN